MESPVVELRRAGPDDVDVIVATFHVGLESYVEFAPPGWRPPDAGDDLERAAELLARPDTWASVALVAGEPVGHVAFFPARERAVGEPPAPDWDTQPLLPGVAHLWQLFVLPAWWGAGVGAALHEAAVAAMGERDYRGARLFTPSAHARARRFYERRGWRLAGEGEDSHLGLELAEYRLDLEPGN